VGISTDPVDRQKEFDERNNLGFPLLSDPDKKVATALGAKRRGPLSNRRISYVIDTDRTLLGIVKSETNMLTHADNALAILRERNI
jgi:thioredoxin-dependent peroxiredoxin|tara:strand:- start:110 stop:367 length:258 start_codon:yes stop_codon:yes gene_type:complete